MAQEKAPRLVKAQFILFGVLLLVFFVWASRSCNRSTAEAEIDQITNEATLRADSLAALLAATQANTPPQPTDNSVQRDTMRGGQMQLIRERVTPLYVTIENLAMRKGPGVNFEILDRLKLYEEVKFLNEVTLTRDSIKLGTVTAFEPWVKIRNEKGRDGWVYGAGVEYYKYKFEGI
jgi:uncharacterized protein YgiM (DUF1202 family)